MPSRLDVLCHPLVAGACVALVTCAAYLRAPQSPFQYDDHYAVVDALPFLDARGILHSWLGFPHGRPLTQTSLAFDAWRAGGIHPRAFHVTNLLLHLVAAALVYRLAGRLLAGRKEAPLAAALAALVFALHPLQAQAAGYVVNRSSILAAIGAMGCVLAVLRAAEGSLLWLLPAALAWILGQGGKETAITAPVLALATLAASPVPRRPGRLPVLAASLGLLLAVLGSPFLGEVPGWIRGEGLAYLRTQLWVVPNYARLTLLPWPMSVTHLVSDLGGLSDPRAAWALAAWLAVAAAAWALRRRPLALWAMAWGLVALAPESSIAPLEDRMMEHRVYLALAAPALAAGWLLARLAARPAAGAGVAALPALLALGTLGRGTAWAEPRALWAEACRVSPRAQKAWINLGQMEVAHGRAAGAARWTFRALALRPGDAEALLNLGALHLQLDDRPGAEACWRLLPEHPEACFGLGGLCQESGRLDEAERWYTRAVLVSGRRHLKALNALGTLYAERRELGRARALFEEVLARRRGDPTARLNLGLVLGDEGLYEEARPHLEEARRLSPSDPLACLALGKSYQAEAGVLWGTLPHPPDGAYDPGRLRRALEEGLSLKPADPVLAETLRRLDLLERRWEDALAAFRGVLAFAPAQPRPQARAMRRAMAEALERMGSIATARGDLERGCALLKESLALVGDNPRARAFLEANARSEAPPPAPARPFLPEDLSGPAPAPAAP